MRTFHLKVAGVTFDNRQRVVSQLRAGDLLHLIPEPSNPYDNHAVRVVTSTGADVGYIPREHNRMIFESLQNGSLRYNVRVSAITGAEYGVYGVNIEISY